MPRNPRAQGPRPLMLHLAAQMTGLLTSLAALPHLKNASPSLKGPFSSLAPELESANPEALRKAVQAEAESQIQDFQQGIAAWLTHPYRRSLTDPPSLWAEGTTRLLDYGGTGRLGAVLLVPSLVNRAYILDLAPGRSLARFLAAQGHRVFLIDWDAPGESERAFGLSDYIAGRLERALRECARAHGGKVALAGYCMGGLLALALAQRRSEAVSKLALLATPWDFHAGKAEQAMLLNSLKPGLQPLLDRLGELPLDMLQSLFAALDPDLAARKFRAFAHLDPSSPQARSFVALEDWVNDGVPLTRKVAEETLFGWYGDNRPFKGTWEIAGRAVKPQELACPSLVIVPGQDRIVPPASARAVMAQLPFANLVELSAGHIGMMVGGGAEEKLYRPLSDWLTG
ncbi:MAG: alpha/beta fold hydrolase [Alphaproteobacteria bacterium]|nr:alpha/beta fold hydrolase [Alphaproteobacteria bacterium]